MIGKLLGALDIFTALAIIFFQFNITPSQMIFSLSFYLLIKFIIFFGDMMSIIDGIIGMYMLIMLVLNIATVSWIFSVYLIIKGIWSMF
jgi:hypothetical protein